MRGFLWLLVFAAFLVRAEHAPSDGDSERALYVAIAGIVCMAVCEACAIIGSAIVEHAKIKYGESGE